MTSYVSQEEDNYIAREFQDRYRFFKTTQLRHEIVNNFLHSQRMLSIHSSNDGHYFQSTEGGVGSYNNSINKTEILPLDSNEFLSKSLWPNMAENLLASCYNQKD
jgi:hypothetical protein